MSLCEVRVPTYRRPQYLKRALESLIAQDRLDWSAIVMDDSPEQDAKDVVNSFKDDRILYSPNSRNLGSAANLDRAFQSNSFVGRTYACVLEDDNWLFPSFLSENICALEDNKVEILLRNQEVRLQNNPYVATARTTRGSCLLPKKYTPIELQSCVFLCEGISNGGLFWKNSLNSDLKVGDEVKDAGLQEYCRTLQIIDNLSFESKPLSCWLEMPISSSLRDPVNNRIFGRGVQSVKQHVIYKHGKNIIAEAQNNSVTLDKVKAFEHSLLDALFLNHDFQFLNRFEILKRYIKSYAKHKLVKDPLNEYFAQSS